MTDLQETVRAKADEIATRTSKAWHDAGFDKKAAAVAAGLAAAGAKLKDAELDERAVELAHRLRESKTAKQASDVAREYGDKAVDRLNDWLEDTKIAEWLEDTKTAERLGLNPKPPKKRRSKWLMALLAVAALGAALAARSRASGNRSMGSLETTGPGSGAQPSSPADTPQAPLADKVRTAIGQDPRTRDLPERLNVNVIEGTVFVRGPVPSDYNEDDLRLVVEGVDGVTDVDLQVTHSS